MEKIKGGFPPIKYCPEINESDKQNPENIQRSGVYGINRNVNISQILSNTINKPLFDLNLNKDEDLVVLDKI